MYIARNKSIKTQVLLFTDCGQAEEKALLDSGATENFIHPKLVLKHKLKKSPLPKPRTVRNINGTTNQMGKITHTVEMLVQHNDQINRHAFLVAAIGEDDLILSYPFFESANPQVDWTNGLLKGNVVLSAWDDWTQVLTEKGEDKTWTHDQIAKITVAQQLAEEATEKTKRTWQELVPERYHRHGKVFSELASEQFPGERQWDHAIDLKSDTPTSIDCKVYPLAPKEKEEQRKFLKTNLRLKQICRSNSPYASSFFLIKKKDGKFRPVQDYRNLNKWTIPNKYPLLLISELVHNLADKQLFSKFDVCWGYNNV